MAAIAEAIVALRRVENEAELPRHALRAIESGRELLEMYVEEDGANHLRAVESEKVGA